LVAANCRKEARRKWVREVWIHFGLSYDYYSVLNETVMILFASVVVVEDRSFTNVG